MSGRFQSPLGLVLDPDAVGDAGHVVEVADHLDRVRDLCVRESLGAQRLDVGLVDLGGEVVSLTAKSQSARSRGERLAWR